MGGSGSALRVCADHRGGINWLSLSPDGQRLLTGSEDGTARLWSTADGQCCALLQGSDPPWPVGRLPQNVDLTPPPADPFLRV
jgi:WD40 repeat protein